MAHALPSPRPRVLLALACLLPLLLSPAAAAAAAAANATTPHPYNIDPQWCPNTIARQNVVARLAGWKCKGIVIPWSLCTSCRLRKFDKKGNFADNRDIYDLSTPQCRWAMRDYVNRNPCDTPRKRDLNAYHGALNALSKWNKKFDWRASRAAKDLGEFMYNTCELCCDCVPMGARPWHYAWRKRKTAWVGKPGSLIHVYRGNCPVHYYYDTCRMWPNLRDVTWPGGKLDLSKDRICQDHVYPWWFNKNNYKRNWLYTAKVTIPSKRFVYFLAKITHLLGCKEKRQWQDCTRMELAQKRV